MDTKLLRQKILDLAIHGKLVPQDPNDEPASVLFERIKKEKEQLIKKEEIRRSKRLIKTSDAPNKIEKVLFEIPNGWMRVHVEDLFVINPKSILADDTEVGFVPMAYVDGGFSGKHIFERRKWGEVKKGFCHFKNGDIGIAKISPCFENLKSTIFSSLPNCFGAGTTELVILRSLGVIAKFYLYLFKSNWYIKEGTKDFKGVVGQQRVNKNIFSVLDIPLPPLVEQQRIVTEIDKWFALIDSIESNKVDLENTIKRTKSKILDIAIHGKLVPQDPDDEPASELLKRINPKAKINSDISHYEQLPKGWTCCTLEEVLDYEQPQAYIVTSTNYQINYSIPVLTAGKSFIIGYTKENYGVCNNLPVIIFDDFTTESKYVDFPFKVKSSAMKILHAKTGLNTKFIQLIMANIKFKNETHKRYWISEYSKMAIVLPPIKEQERIVNAIDKIQEQLNKIYSIL